MSHPFTVFIGPYAEWQVHVSKVRRGPKDEDPRFEGFVNGPILYLGDYEGLPKVKVGRLTYVVYRFMPDEHRPDRPTRQMQFYYGEPEGDCEDWSWINPRAEIDWFSEAFAAELSVLRGHFGEDPTLGWGVVRAR